MAKNYSRIFLILPEIKQLILQKRKDELKNIFYDYEPIEIAEALKELSLKDKVYLFSLWDIDFATDIFEKMDNEDQIALLSSIDEVHKKKILNGLAPDERVDLFEELSPEMVNRFLSIMEKEEAKDTKELMRYETTTAGGIMTTEFANVREEVTVEKALNILRKTAKDLEMVYYIYVLDNQNKLVGVLSLKELILAHPQDRISQVMHHNPIALPVDMDQEEVSKEIARDDFVALPVIDSGGKMKGIITVDDVIDVIDEENTEDMYKFGAAGEHLEEYMKMRSTFIAKNRLIWLTILTIAGFFSGIIIQKFSFALENVIALSFYIPVLMGSAGNAGTQAAMVVVRGLATGEVKIRDIWSVVKKEFFIGGMLGIPLGLMALARALIFQKNSFLGISVALSMLITIIFATCLGAALPLICKWLRLDPAVVSGPLITTILDISSLMIYFAISIFFLGL